MLPRTSCVCNEETGQIELRFSATLPAAGRTILGLKAATLLCDWIPQIVRAALLYSNQDRKKLFLHIQYVEDQEFLRGQLSSRGLVAFVANGSVLPRKSGVSSLPMSSNVVRFTSPPELEVQLDSPHAGRITGMGIPKGITVLTGGGFHGKSTLLEALQLGIYNVVHGDGRERVVSDTTSVKIRAEDGRSVSGVNISPFISNLPGGKGTRSFSTEDASGSTSMAANIIEAVELGAKTLLIDEDASATNMLVRDARMSTLIKAEPITPLISRVRALYTRHGVSTIIVVGGLGDWLTVADNVIGMQDYVPRLLNSDAAEVIRHFPTQVEQLEDFHSLSKRRVCVPGHLIGHKGPMAKSKELIMFPNARRAPFAGDTAADGNGEGREEAPVSRDMGEQELDLSALEQLVERGQAKTIAVALRNFTLHPRVELHQTAKTVEQSKLARMDMGGDLVAVRALEVGMAVGRLRGLLVE